MSRAEGSGIDLRQRRRSQTRAEIVDAALKLFEDRGVGGTTVEDIAAGAGVSPRTFYRLCGSKEQAVLDDDEIAAALGQLVETIDGSMALRPQLVAFWRARMADLEADAEGHHRYLRVRRLISQEPALLAAALRQEHDRDEAFVTALVRATGYEKLQVRALVEWLSVLIRLAVEEWLCVTGAGRQEDLQQVYDRALSALEGSFRI
ncbi:TetR/AcrR family transcriptional regulator [Rothia sp. AR01]|uniref:TetR/AcrR family transcriptional regulator n=1 Tax=Rothia santali TaxID=2949643 RepID=A0A9X2HJ55_9MICC|nr:TetR/AcrR family transcriptional regulator [Rothia santali]MCP3425218.1 TetR/AcrR family transcriptional regulator [Rothia santali]